MKRKSFLIFALLLTVILLLEQSTMIYATESTENAEQTQESSSSEESSSNESESNDGTSTKIDKSEARARAQAELENAKKEKEELESALANAEALVNNLKQSKSSTEEKIASLNGQLSTINSKITVMENQLGDLETQIGTAESELEVAEAETAAQYEAMKLRIKYMYENGSHSYVAMIFSSKSIAELLNAIDYISMLSLYDRQMLDTYQENVEIKEEIKAELEAEYETAKTMREEIGVQKQTVQVLKDAKTEELGAIGEDLADAQAVAEAYEQEVKAQNEILAQIQATINALDYDETYISSSGFMWPCPSFKYVSSDYGPRTSPTSGASSNHKGIDLAAPYGSAILASESGVVTTAAYSSSAGNYVIVNHGTDSNGNIICTVYMHCSSIAVSQGESVVRGQTIAAVGSTGVSTGNHLHFAVTCNGSYVSPWGYVAKP